jgi:3-phenylpropionate/cinnamic acid dioxygenase small subunit
MKDGNASNNISPNNISLQLVHDIQQFYFREARLLDERQYQQWLSLLTEDVVYRVPARHTPFLDTAKRETEALLDIAQDISSGMEPPWRDDNFLTLSIRVMRSFKMNSWTDNPPARTTRLVSNIEINTGDAEDVLLTRSNVLIAYSRYGMDNHTYTGRRQDTLRHTSAGWKICRREVLLDWNVITGPSVGLFF